MDATIRKMSSTLSMALQNYFECHHFKLIWMIGNKYASILLDYISDRKLQGNKKKILSCDVPFNDDTLSS